MLRLLVQLGALAAAAATGAWQKSSNITVYRITPYEMQGIADMDSADAAGDIAFGLSQLLLPFICSDPVFISFLAYLSHFSRISHVSLVSLTFL